MKLYIQIPIQNLIRSSQDWYCGFFQKVINNNYHNKSFDLIFILFIILGPLTLDSYTNFEFNDNLIRSIRAYLCYTCFSWLKPLYTSVKKKLNLPVEEDFTDKEKYFSEVIILTQQFQQLFNKYIHDVMDKETLNYFKAKKEIERINQLLTTSSFKNNTDGKCLIFYSISFLVF